MVAANFPWLSVLVAIPAAGAALLVIGALALWRSRREETAPAFF